MTSTTSTTMLIFTAILMTSLTTDAAVRKAVPPVANCSTVLPSLIDCLSYVTNGSTTLKPEGSCCPALKNILLTTPDCLCQGFKESPNFNINLNVTKAATLPSACGLQAPSASKCTMTVPPAIAPVGPAVPAVTPAVAPTAPSTTPGTTETAPTPAPSSTDSKTGSSSSIGISVYLIIAGLAAALFTSF